MVDCVVCCADPASLAAQLLCGRHAMKPESKAKNEKAGRSRSVTIWSVSGGFPLAHSNQWSEELVREKSKPDVARSRWSSMLRIEFPLRPRFRKVA